MCAINNFGNLEVFVKGMALTQLQLTVETLNKEMSSIKYIYKNPTNGVTFRKNFKNFLSLAQNHHSLRI